jgi:hypothetical protein
MTEQPIRWAAELSHVKEVSLRGAAELEYWRRRLEPEGLVPLERNGAAEVLVIAAEGRFHGITFREVSFSVSVVPPRDVKASEAAYLLCAYNSSRFFAWCERTFFSTPYRHGVVRVDASLPASIELLVDGRTFFHAGMAEASGAAAPAADGGWDGAVLIPRNRRSRQQLFFARLRGDIETNPFEGGATLHISPKNDQALQALLDSHFSATRWELRCDATHAKSKTYARD